MQVVHELSGKCVRLDGEGLSIWDCQDGDSTQLFGFQQAGEEFNVFVKATLKCLSTNGYFSQRTCDNDVAQRFGLKRLDRTRPVFTFAPTALGPFETISIDGVAVFYNVSATDDTTMNPRISCFPKSGARVPAGNTTAFCSVNDNSGNQATARFPITIGKTARHRPAFEGLLSALG